ncbi:MAG TPA: 50S ribosomal protein L11 methyltransferase [Casimicrobiaceae bacterium]|jgi:ribosomal protein L11 methyltransferase|nr:50S ribosomal protein L11 methyltransferase [Casimicrobiaceae bacterium]
MSLTALRFDVSADDAERWSDALLDAGALSVDATDPRVGTAEESPVWGEQTPGPREWWPVTRLTALCNDDGQASTMLHDAAAAVARGIPSFETYRVADRDWVRETQAQFAPIRIRDDFWIVPSCCAPPRRDALNVILDPGLAFGTGSHPTTRLCLEWLAAQHMRGLSLLDYGCGSGILAIAGALLGASPVVGTDIDPQAIVASRANAAANGAGARFVHVDALDGERYLRVVANILARPLAVLAPAFAARTQPGGRIALSGILANQADDVMDAYAPWFDMACARTEDGWVLLDGRRRSDAR